LQRINNAILRVQLSDLCGGSFTKFGESGKKVYYFRNPWPVCNGYSVPLDSDYQTLINFWGPAKTFETYSCIDVLNGKIKPESFKDK